MYKRIIKPVLFKFDPGKVHGVFVFMGELLGKASLTRFLLRSVYGYKGKDISRVVDGIKYKTPIVLSAGFDYDARLLDVLGEISFGGVEVGSITAKPCAGNPGPNLTRLPNTKSIIVNKGLKNRGVDAVIDRLKKRRKNDLVVGVSLARTNSKECAGMEEGIEDYLESFRKLNAAKVGDYYTINISCPNAYGGETFAKADNLERLFGELDKIECSKPIYVKMPISISNEEYIGLLDVLAKHRVSGVVVGNLQKDYSFISKKDKTPKEYRGGLSGAPCRARSNELISLTKSHCGEKFTIIGCGGVFSPEDAKEKFEAGADLIHLITGMIYEGPGLMKRICLAIDI